MHLFYPLISVIETNNHFIPSAMKTEIRFGMETMDSHFNRCSVPNQGWLVQGINPNEQPIKAVYHFFGSDAAKSNRSYTLSCLDQLLQELAVANFIDCDDAKKLVFMRLLLKLIF